MTAAARRGARGRPLAARLALSLSLALSLACGAAHAAGAPLGRLFATPSERAQLDARRDGQPGAGVAPAAPAPVAAVPDRAPPPEPAPPTTLDGVVRRSGGGATVWLNQAPQPRPNQQLGSDAGAAALSLQLPSGQTVILKPGQSYHPADGTVRENREP